MSISIRDVLEHELDAILAMNNAAGSGILPMNQEQIRFFWQQAAYFRVAESDNCLVGFLIAMNPDTDYESSNFAWFAQRRRVAGGTRCRRPERAGHPARLAHRRPGP